MWPRLLNRLEQIRNSYWFVPGLLLLGAIALAIGSHELDRAIGPRADDLSWWMPDIQPGPAQAVLLAVASAAVSLASLVFSITLVVLTLTAGQYGSRILRRFMTDRVTQFVLGLFTATFVYCLIVLLGIHRLDAAAFTPRAGVAGAIGLAVLDVGVLTFFIHHVSLSIQASNMVGKVAEDLNRAIEELFPDELGEDRRQQPAGETLPEDFERGLVRLYPDRPGYVLRIDAPALLRAATELDLVLRVPRVGEFIGPTPLLEVYPAERADQAARNRLTGAMILGPMRTPTQDIEYCVDRLVEIAARALSPGINDPFTAVTCIHHLGAAMCRFAGRRTPSTERYDEAGRLRAVCDVPGFADVLSHGFDPIRQYGAGQLIVTTQLFEALAGVARSTHDPVRLRAVRALMDRVWLTCRRDQSEDPQLPMIKRAHSRALAVAPVPETEPAELKPVERRSAGGGAAERTGPNGEQTASSAGPPPGPAPAGPEGR